MLGTEYQNTCDSLGIRHYELGISVRTFGRLCTSPNVPLRHVLALRALQQLRLPRQGATIESRLASLGL